MTVPRAVVCEVLDAADGHLTAEGIAERVRDRAPRVNLASVYRTLALLVDLGFVHESRAPGAQAATWEVAHRDDQMHLSCRRCGAVDHHSAPALADAVDHVGRAHGFHAEAVHVSLIGTCASCRGDVGEPRSAHG